MKIKNFQQRISPLLFAFSFTIFIQAGCEKDPPASATIFKEKFSIPFSCSSPSLSAKMDVSGRPYLYVASKEGGIKIFNVSKEPQLVKTIPIDSLHSLHAMNLSQTGNFLYAALGNHFGNTHQHPGMAIIDVTNPGLAEVTAVWSEPGLTGGAGIIETVGNYSYLGAMQNGLFIFDVSNKSNPAKKSVFKPVLNYPDANPDPKKYNARGLAVKDDLVFLCFDAGGIRVINTADKSAPVETGYYSNAVMNGKPRAYNNIILDNNLAYVGVDYCGMEIIDISNPAQISLKSWWNPWQCQTSPLKWFSSPGHINELAFDSIKKWVFMSSGKSDLQVVDVSNPQNIKHIREFGGISNSIGTWGVSRQNNILYLSYICSVIPFTSNWSGVKAIEYN